MYDISATELVQLHPFHALSLRTIAASNGELPVDLKLLPEHCVVLFEALKKHLTPLKIDVSDLDPNTFFKVQIYFCAFSPPFLMLWSTLDCRWSRMEPIYDGCGAL